MVKKNKQNTSTNNIIDGSMVIVRNINKQQAIKFAKTIYENFIELTRKPELQHNITEIVRLLTYEKSKTIFIFVNNKIAAYLVGEYKELNDGRRVFYVSYLYTATQFRKNGFASKLMAYIEELTLQFEYDGVMLTCNVNDDRAYDFYSKRSYFPDIFLKTHQQHEVLYKQLY